MRLSVLLGVGAFLLYALNKFYIAVQLNWSFAQNYLNDVLAGLLVVAVVNILALLSNEGRLLLTRLGRVLFFTLLCGVFWEYVTPLYLHYSVSDPFDVAAYMFGGFLNWGIIKVCTRPKIYGTFKRRHE